MTNFKRLTKSLNQMADGTYRILRSTLSAACTMMICALTLFLVSDGASVRGFEAYMIARELFSLSSATLLVGMIAALLVEDGAKKK